MSKSIIKCVNKNEAVNKLTHLNNDFRVVAKDINEEGAKEYFIMSLDKLCKKLQKDHNIYECFDSTFKVKFYLDIDDTESETLEESEKYVSQLLLDIGKYFNIDDSPLKITAHGFDKKKQLQKFSYSFIFTKSIYLTVCVCFREESSTGAIGFRLLFFLRLRGWQKSRTWRLYLSLPIVI